METIYLDHAATSFPKADGVAEAVFHLLRENAVNVGRGGYDMAYALSAQVLETRQQLLALFHAPKDAACCFTAGATAALNTFLFGLLRRGDHVVTGSMEHNAVMRPLFALRERGVAATVVQAEKDGILPADKLEDALRENTRAVILTHASNVCGTLMPLEAVGHICQKHHVFYAVDAAQTAGVLPVDMEKAGIDFLAFPGHKGLRGPQGVGGFLIRSAAAQQLHPLIFGGTGSLSHSEAQPALLPDKFESGTLPLPAIIGLAAAVRQLNSAALQKIRAKEQRLTRLFLEGLQDIPGVYVPGIAEPERMEERVGVVSVDFKEKDNALAAFALEKEFHILTRVGLHCAPRAHQTIGTFPQGTVRFSFGPDTAEEEVSAALAAIRHLTI